MTERELLNGRYALTRQVSADGDLPEIWEAVDADGYRFLTKLWPFADDGPDAVQRSLWDHELRTLYRIASSPAADLHVLRVRDAAVDRSAKAFVMVLQGEGYQRLADVLASPASHSWLGSRSVERRVGLWSALRSLAQGLSLLHRQQVLHRAISADSIFLDAARGPDSMRLGGFEWSVRLSTMDTRTAPATAWSVPPEMQGREAAYLPDTDWFGFGMLAARLVVNLERHTVLGADDLHAAVHSEVEGAASNLSGREQDLLLRLIDRDPLARLVHHEEILREIGEIERDLGGELERRDVTFVLVVDPKSEVLVEMCKSAGMVVDPEDEFAPFNPLDLTHVANLSSFIRERVKDPVLYPSPDPMQVVIAGELPPLKLGRWRDQNGDSWDMAFCIGPASISTGDSYTPRRLPSGAVAIRTVGQAHRESSIRASATSWESYLPRTDGALSAQSAASRLIEFLKASNQVELVIRDAEVFRYRMVSRSAGQFNERIILVEEPTHDETRPVWSVIQGGLVQHLTTELASNKPDCDRVVITPDRDLRVDPADKSGNWTIEAIDPDKGTVSLQRPSADHPPAPEIGFIRTWGMAIGQVPLIARRAESIERTLDHTYLLQALTSPGFVYMDTGEVELPVTLLPNAVDSPKRAVIEDVLRVRPIYALQGPPGTGKTTMVAWLLREVLADDPVAQLLVTAQAHGALDVLRHRVSTLFEDLDQADRPLAVRLGGRDEAGSGTPAEVAAEVLAMAESSLQSRSELSNIEREWLQAIDEMLAEARSGTAGSLLADFERLVQRSANLTYCTTSAGDLAQLARDAQSFDWSIIEEAGKAHGFDLALPLWAGHRWLLIGDHEQLPPYRYEDYKAAFGDLTTVVSHLWAMQRDRRGGGLVDVGWLQDWDAKTEDERHEAVRFAERWLATFDRIFQVCQRAPGTADPSLTLLEPIGAAAGMLSGQHRMHPTIGDLISTVFYDGGLTNETIGSDGKPLDRVRHQLTTPDELREKSILWIDLPSAMRDPAFAETGPPDTHPYVNRMEIEALYGFLEAVELSDANLELTFAALSPYNRQRGLIDARLRNRGLPSGLVPANLAYGGESDRYAYTVDSFQGNQADIVAVSLVRNNTSPKEQGLGFLDRARMNVLLSRAERLLVLVGSWEFFVDQVSLIDREDRSHRFSHWAQVLDFLELQFESGSAVRLDAIAQGFVS